MKYLLMYYDNVEDEWITVEYRYYSTTINAVNALGHNSRFDFISWEKI